MKPGETITLGDKTLLILGKKKEVYEGVTQDAYLIASPDLEGNLLSWVTSEWIILNSN